MAAVSCVDTVDTVDSCGDWSADTPDDDSDIIIVMYATFTCYGAWS